MVKILLSVVFLVGLAIFVFILINTTKVKTKELQYAPTQASTQKSEESPTVTNTPTPIPIKTLRRWVSNWDNGRKRTLGSGQQDPFDKEFFARGNGTVEIDGEGIARMRGDSPRMYIMDPAKKLKWENVEVVFYAKRISETGAKSSQGFVIGVRSEHQDVTGDKPCLGRTYYGRLLYDGRAVFQKELIHDALYSDNKPTENNKVIWNTPDGTLPKDVWIGVKFIVKTNPDKKSVKLELFRDLTDGKNGGTWEKVADYIDNGDWSQTDTNLDINAKCGYNANEVILNPGTSVFIRNDMIGEAQYKNFRVRELTVQ